MIQSDDVHDIDLKIQRLNCTNIVRLAGHEDN